MCVPYQLQLSADRAPVNREAWRESRHHNCFFSVESTLSLITISVHTVYGDRFHCECAFLYLPGLVWTGPTFAWFYRQLLSRLTLRQRLFYMDTSDPNRFLIWKDVIRMYCRYMAFTKVVSVRPYVSRAQPLCWSGLIPHGTLFRSENCIHQQVDDGDSSCDEASSAATEVNIVLLI